MNWNYRVIEFDGYKAIHEVYYSDSSDLLAYSETAAVVSWDVDEGTQVPLAMLKKMLESLDKPVLTESDFKSEAG